MEYYLDFDYTLFDTHAFREELYKILEKNGFDKTYLTLTPELKENGQKLLNIKELFKSLSKLRNIPINNFLEPLEELYSRGSEFLYDDTVEFLKYLKSKNNNVYILTWGEKEYQDEKIKASKLYEYIDKVIFAEDLKYTLDINYENGIFIDDSALDNKTWGEGWQWDDDMNVLMPRFSSYNLDKNLIKLTIIPTQKGQFAKILNPSKYPLVFFNNIVTSDKTELDVHRDSTISPNTLVLKGTVARPTVIYIPTADLKRYFNVQLTHAMEERSLYLKETISVSKLKDSDTLETSVKHNINNAISDVLRNSNNMVAETLFKLAGAKHIGAEYGSDAYGIKMFNDYCVKNNLDNSRIRITDASGVSKNNHVSADFITDFLGVNKDNKLMEKLPAPGEGTLTHRMLPLKDSLKAKTGTLSDISTIAGYLTSKSGKKYAFCIMINDMKLTTSDKKMLEDFIIREAYLKL